MKYALGNMLNGAGGLNADQLALDLQFAADKTLTARKGPTPVLTRASTATFVGSNGLIQSAAINAARFDHDPVTLASRGLLIEEGRTNLVFPSDTLTTQTRTVTAVAHTLSFYGTGTVVLSGVATATVTGTGAFPTRTTLTFTPTAGSLTLTVTGSVQFAQVEAGSFPTSYIPTTTSALARSADVCNITGANFTGFYNQPEGTLFGSGIVDTVGVGLIFPFFLTLNDGTANNRILLGSTNSAGSAVRPIITNTGPNIYTQPIGTVSAGQSRKVALAYKSSDFMAAANSQLAIAGTTGSPPSGLNRADINGAFFVGTIASIRYYKKRLSNAKLQALTAP